MRLATDPTGIAGVESGKVQEHLGWNLGLWVGWEHNPLVLHRLSDGERVGALVSNRVGGAVTGAVGLGGWAQLGLELPAVFSQDRKLDAGASPAALPALTAGGVGNLRLVPKARFLNSADHGLDMAVMFGVLLPTGSQAGFVADPGLGVQPELALSSTFGPMRVAGNLGAALRRSGTVLDLTARNELTGSLGAGYRLGSRAAGTLPLELQLSLGGNVAAREPFKNANETASEARFMASYEATSSVQVFAGGGRGLSQGWGTPDWRVFSGVRYATEPEQVARDDDRDKDKVTNDQDRCPDQPGLLELQGCPDPDPDRDRVLGEADACPNEAGPVETRGCPDTDPDRDRVLGEADACPNEAGPIGNRGCPDDPDPDRDGVFGAQDACPKVAGPVENKGCPDKDTDRDGLVDRLDPCPTVAGPADNNGCPDTDSDGDSLVDRLDACPTAAGPAANRGCPEKAAEPPKAGEVTMRDNKIVFKGTVHFATNRDVIQSKSFSLLDSIADFIKAHPEMKKVIVEGHTDNVGGDAHNLALSQRRAQAIVRYLVNKGVAPNLLEAQGFGATKPVADNKTDKGRAQNRRVEFTVTFDALTVTAVTEAGRGAVTFDSVAGTITYVPATGFVGGDSFTYTVDDAHGGTATGRVNVTVVNRAPVAREDAVSGHAPSIVINVLGNDVDEDLDTLTAAAGAPPAHGRVTVNANGTILYEPNAGFTGTDSFTYTVRDSRGATATGRVMVTVLNSAPVAANDTLTGRAPRLGTNVLANDSDVDGDALTVTAVTQPARGSVTFRPDGTVTYAPGPGFTGTDSFTYTVSDRPGSSSTGTVTVNVLAGTDSDGDCLTDDEEIAAGTNPSDADSDDDGVTECREPRWNVDVDGDGLINALDPDSDNDGLFDGTELGVTSADTATDVRKGNFVPDADASTVTNPLDRDTDRGSVSDGAEDSNHNGRIDPGERDPNNPADDRRRGDPFTNDSDGDGLPDTEERTHGTDPYDADSEDDGIIDGAEENWTADTDGDGLINALDPDSDSDGLFDGTEAGVVVPGPATHLAAGHFIADADPSTTTRPLLPDTDSGSVRDGDEDANHDGKVDSGERDPNVKADDVTLLPPPPEGYGVTGGGGCSTAGGAGGLSAILLLALSALRFRRRAR